MSPTFLCNLCHRFFLTSLTTFHHLIPYSSVFSCTLQSLPFFFSRVLPQLIYLTTSPAPSHYPPLSSLLPFLAISSPHPSVVFIFTGVMSLENVPLEDMTGNRRQRCLAGALPVCSPGTGKAPQRVLTPRGCAASDRMTRGGCVREEKGQEGICYRNSGSGLELFRDKQRRLAGKWKHSLMSHVWEI